MINNLLSLEQSNLLILSIVLLTVAPLSSIYSWYLTLQFKTNKSEVKFANKLWVSIMITLQFLSIASSIMSIVFYFIDLNLSQTLFIVCIVIAFATSAIWFSMVLFFSNQIWFYMDEEKIVTLGESIKLSKIQKIIEDDQKSAVYVNYLEGRRTIKKVKFSKKTALGIYFLENASKTGVTPEKGDQVSYFKEQIAKIRQEALEMTNKSVKTPVEPVENKTEKEAKEKVEKVSKDVEQAVEKTEEIVEKPVKKPTSSVKKPTAKSKASEKKEDK
ncbi:hypothetical protein [Spiroplasma cantharicola]|uniref:Uncharacterized protein n=1 Tax=Spiroplasma cantharicola TaxID=362837 RepID=A0A0M4JRU3_9MOLU|nr:hypothetical protein [Spiroplasma cantharicola]ALD66147.1 hypothetical protein SCANT_v1c02370 [Spiroplasma cantharicola]